MPESLDLVVDAGVPIGTMRDLQGASGMPGPAHGADRIPDISRDWQSARVGLVRTYDWVSRLATVDDPNGLFPNWSADPEDPASYNFAATDSWVRQVQAIDAEIMFTIASSVPSNRLPTSDLAKYERVVENIVRHYVCGWGGGEFDHAITRWEFGDQPDFSDLHFAGTPDEFYAMYAAAARAVKGVDSGLKFGGPCPAFPLDEGPFRDGFLEFVRRNELPLDFFTWMWFTDDSRDPLDFRIIAAEMRVILDANGFESAELILSYWNMTGIPNAQFVDADVAAFHAAAAVYMQDSVVDRAILFRADTGTDLHYGFTDPAGIFEPDGSENAKTGSFRLIGQTLAARERLSVTGGNENGFAVLAGRTRAADVVRVLIANYVIPEQYLNTRDRDVLEFQVPVGAIRSNISLSVLPRRVHARGVDVIDYSLEVVNLPWESDAHEVVRYRVDGMHIGEMLESGTGQGPTASVIGRLVASAVEMVEITPIRVEAS